MSDLPMNDHLEGILSDFEALKRSFDTEDVEDTPSFTSVSPVPTPISPSACHFFLNHNKTSEVQGGGGRASAFTFNKNSLGSSVHTHTHLNSKPSPVLKSRTVASSLSFNRGTTNKPFVHNNGGSVARAASFQSRLNPNTFSMLSRPGSDNDSLHSSTSSLEYSGVSGYTLPLGRMGSYHNPQSQQEYRGTVDTNMKKVSYHGNVFSSEVNQKQGLMQGIQEPQDMNHGSISFHDIHIPDGLDTVGMQKGGTVDRTSLQVKYHDANANWNGHLHNSNAFGEERYSGFKKHSQQQDPRVQKPSQPKAKETPRLNKFPLDLDSLVNSISPSSPTNIEMAPVNPIHPNPISRSSGGTHHHFDPPSTAASPSASLSSLDSSSDTVPHPFHHSFSNFSLSSPSQSSSSVPEMIASPLSPAQTFQLDILPRPQVVQVVSNLPSPSSSSSMSSLRAVGSLDDGDDDTRDTVGLILQRIASFSWPITTDSPVIGLTQSPGVQSNRESTTAVGVPIWKQEKKGQEEPAGESETDQSASMEESGEKERIIMADEPEEEVKNEERRNVKTSVMEKVEKYTMEEEEKGKEKGTEIKKEVELEAELKVDICPSAPGLQVSFVRGSDLFGYVGIEAVLDQMRRKTMKAGFEFNIMVVGQSGLGKSTLVNTLFKSKISRKSCTANYDEKIPKTVKLHSVSHVIEEKGVKMKLTVVDTPGFGDQINNENCWEPIVEYVNEQNEKYLREELHVTRKRRIPDSRVHCCIYFLPATGHRLRPIDVEFMQRLGKIVNIVPVIAKADTLTVEEREEFKERIRRDLAANGIRIYPQAEYDEDPEDQMLNDRIRESLPFAVVGTDKEHQVNGNRVLGRKTKWGIIEVENVAHCEFANLRDLLIRSHLQDLKEVTHHILYEKYRVQRLNESNITFSELGLSAWPLENGTEKNESDSHL
ncbi:unnamed protein product [Ophioblennius macclurei]